MIFAVTGDGKDSLFLFLSEKDLRTIKTGRTLFVDERQYKGNQFTFKGAIVAYAATDAEAIKMIDQYGRGNPEFSLKPMQPADGEGKCRGCQGIMPAHLIIDGQCGLCWRDAYKRVLGELVKRGY